MANQIPSDDDLLTEAEVSAWIKYSRHRLQRWRKNNDDERGGPPFYRFDKKVLYKRGDVRVWLDSKRIAPQPRPDASSIGSPCLNRCTVNAYLRASVYAPAKHEPATVSAQRKAANVDKTWPLRINNMNAEPIVGDAALNMQDRTARWARIPQALRDRPQWCVAAPDKAPWTVSGGRASSTDSATWATFDAACAAASAKGWHIGYMLHANDPFTCIDLDVCDAASQARKGQPIDPSKWTTQTDFDRFQRIYETFGSYTERSTYGKGLHIWLEGKVGVGRKRDGVEVYSQERFIVCTGDVFIDAPMRANYALLNILYAELSRGTQLEVELVDEEDQDERDDWYIAQIAHEADGELGRLFNGGEWEGKYQSASEADLALVTMLARITQSNAKCWSAFRMSPLGKRVKNGSVKAERPDYQRRTLSLARTYVANDAVQVARGKEIAEALYWQVGIAPPTVAGALTAKPLRMFLKEFEAVDFLIDDMYRRGWLYTITGKTGSGKTGVAVTLALCIAAGTPIGKHAVAPGVVLYIAGENPDDVRGRFRATISRNQWGDNALDRIHVIDQSFLLEERITDLEKIIDDLRPAAVFVDTDQAVSLSGDGEENSNNGRMKHAKLLRRMTRRDSRPTVIDLCHPNASKNFDNLVPRGGSAFLNEIDGNTRCSRNEVTTTLASDPDKFRGIAFDIAFRKEEVTLDSIKDTKGRPIATPVFLPSTDQQVVMDAFQAYSERQQLLKAMLQYLHMNQVSLLEYLNWRTTKGELNKPKISRMMKSLREESPPLVTEANTLTKDGEKAAKKLM